jgi:hypothetical protein
VKCLVHMESPSKILRRLHDLHDIGGARLNEIGSGYLGQARALAILRHTAR